MFDRRMLLASLLLVLAGQANAFQPIAQRPVAFRPASSSSLIVAMSDAPESTSVESAFVPPEVDDDDDDDESLEKLEGRGKNGKVREKLVHLAVH